MTPFGIYPYSDIPGRVISSRHPYSYRSAVHFGIWMPGKPLFKYVDLNDAEYLENGSVKIGTLRSYAALEGPRRDAGENYARIEMPSGSIDDPLYRQAVERTGVFKFSPTSKGVHFANGLKVVIPGPNAYCFCASYRGDLIDDPNNPQALFRIDDLSSWCERVEEMNPEIGKLERFQVMYRSRTRSGFAPGDERPHALVKPVEYQNEFEVRVIGGVGRDGKRVPDDDAPVIYGAPDRKLASLMQRIR
jgi:hypothetical protein